MMRAGRVVIPTIQHFGRVFAIVRRERGGEPAVRQRMLMPEAFGEIIERHDVLEAEVEQRSFKRHIGRGRDTDDEANAAFSGG